EQPPHLKAIMPFNSPADFYRECTHHGGVTQTFFNLLYGNSVHGNKICVTKEELSPEDFEALRVGMLSDPDIRMYPRMYGIVDNLVINPSWFDVMAHPTDGPFYWERSPYRTFDKIKIPFYTASGWWAYCHMHLIGAFRNFNEIDAPKKVAIDP